MSKEPEDITPGEVPPAPGYSAPAGDVPAPGYAAPPAPGYAAPPPGAVPPAPGYAVPPAPGYPAPPAYGAPQGYPPVYAGVGVPLSDSDQRMWAMLSHIGTIIFPILAPLIIWLVYKGRGMFVEDQSKESLNFQISMAIVSFAVGIISVITLGFGALLYFPLGIAVLVFVIIAGVKANQGVLYRYPVTYRFIK
jgi:uncharacterized protein